MDNAKNLGWRKKRHSPQIYDKKTQKRVCETRPQEENFYKLSPT